MRRWRRTLPPARAPGGTVVAATLAAVLVATLLGGCSASEPAPPRAAGRGDGGGGLPAPPATAAVPAGLEAFYGQRLRWRDCGGRLECARLRVPVDYAAPDGATLRLAVVRRPADGDRLGSLVLNPGGPGASGVDYARAADRVVTKAVRERYDVVGFDPRGVGRSSPVDCLTDRALDSFLAMDGTPDDAGEEQALAAASRRLGEGCRARTGALLAHVGTRDTARDLDVLRAALGDRRLTYLGKSYGTYLGAIYASMFPGRAGRLVLDGVVDPADDSAALGRAQAVGFQRALGAFLADCLGRRSCPLTGDRRSAAGQVVRFLDEVDARPLRASRPVTQSLAWIGIAEALYDPRDWPFLRFALARGLRGEGDPLLTLADLYAHRGDGGHYTDNLMVALYAVGCLDVPQTADVAELRARAAEFARISPVFGAGVAWGALPCRYWPYPAQGDAAPIRATGAPPILVVGTTRDPATPYHSAVSLARELDRARLLTYDGDGHTAYQQGSHCIDTAVDNYLLTGQLPAAGTAC